MFKLIRDYEETLKMVESAKRQIETRAKAAVVSEGEYLGNNTKAGLMKCPQCGKEVYQIHFYQLDNKTVTVCVKCRDKFMEIADSTSLDFGQDRLDYSKLNSVSTNLRFAIDYMTTGRFPGMRRGVTRLSGEQREKSFDPMNSWLVKQAALNRVSTDDLTPECQEMLNDFLALLSKQQREAFQMVRGQGLTFESTAELMKVSKGTIQSYVNRAEETLYYVIKKGPKAIQEPPISEGNISPKRKRQQGCVQRVLSF